MPITPHDFRDLFLKLLAPKTYLISVIFHVYRNHQLDHGNEVGWQVMPDHHLMPLLCLPTFH